LFSHPNPTLERHLFSFYEEDNNFSRRILAPVNACRLSVSTADGTRSDRICSHSSD